VTINTINPGRNGQIYVDNPNSAPVYDTQFDGFTQVLTCIATVTPGVSNTLRVAIADTSDFILDSAVFIESSGVTSTPKTKYTTLTNPQRALDTRVGLGGPMAKIGAGQTLTLPILGLFGVPNDALSVALNVTAADADANGFLTIFPTGSVLPTASNVNYTPGTAVPNLVVAKIGVDGSISIFAEQPTNVIVDVFGYYSTAGVTGFEPVTPVRVFDSRSGPKPGTDSILTFTVTGVGGVPVGVPAVALNLTLDQPASAGYATAFAADQPLPATSNVNVLANETRPNVVFAPVSADGRVSVYISMPSHVIVDVLGYYTTDSSAQLFKATKPKRLLDTRLNNGPVVPAETEVLLKVTDIGGVPSTAKGVILNITVTGPLATGFLTVFPADVARPDASNLNFVAGQTVPNVVISGVSTDGRIKIYTNAPTHIIVDVSGWFG
jgi:hypothetical protein